MCIDEITYITITNRVKVSAAISFVKDILPGFDGVIMENDRSQILKILYDWEEKLFAKIND